MRDPRWDQIFIPGGKGGIHHLRWDPAIPTWDPGWDCQDPAYIPPDILPGLSNKRPLIGSKKEVFSDVFS